MIVFTKRAEHRGRAAKKVGIKTRWRSAQLRSHLSVYEDRTSDDAVLAHQVFYRADLLLVFFLARFGFLIRLDEFGVGPRQQETDTRRGENTAAAVVKYWS